MEQTGSSDMAQTGTALPKRSRGMTALEWVFMLQPFFALALMTWGLCSNTRTVLTSSPHLDYGNIGLKIWLAFDIMNFAYSIKFIHKKEKSLLGVTVASVFWSFPWLLAAIFFLTGYQQYKDFSGRPIKEAIRDLPISNADISRGNYYISLRDFGGIERIAKPDYTAASGNAGSVYPYPVGYCIRTIVQTSDVASRIKASGTLPPGSLIRCAPARKP